MEHEKKEKEKGMKIESFNVSVDRATALARGIELTPDQMTYKVGSVEVKQYGESDWDSIPKDERGRILTDSNRQRAQDAMNRYRADWKSGGESPTKKRARLAEALGQTTDPAEIARLVAEIQSIK